jgi:hypothetical protein
MKTASLLILSLLLFSCSTPQENEKNLLSYWSFDNSVQGSLNGTSGKDLKTINRGAKVVDGYKGKAMEFDGKSVLEVPYTAQLDSFQQGITVSAWIKKDTSSHWNTIVSREIDSTWSEYIGLAVFKNRALFSVDPDGKRYINTSDTIPVVSDKWIFLAGTFDNKELKLYVNGSLISSKSCTGPLFFHDKNPFLIGGNSNDLNKTFVDCFKGTIDEIRIYNKALCAQEIGDLIKK